jgi:hypothetical protein
MKYQSKLSVAVRPRVNPDPAGAAKNPCQPGRGSQSLGRLRRRWAASPDVKI